MTPKPAEERERLKAIFLLENRNHPSLTAVRYTRALESDLAAERQKREEVDKEANALRTLLQEANPNVTASLVDNKLLQQRCAALEKERDEAIRLLVNTRKLLDEESKEGNRRAKRNAEVSARLDIAVEERQAALRERNAAIRERDSLQQRLAEAENERSDALKERNGERLVARVAQQRLAEAEQRLAEAKDKYTAEERLRWQNVAADFDRALKERTRLQSALSASEQKVADMDSDLGFLCKLFSNCPHAEITYNDDPYIEDSIGMVPVGWNIRVDGCTPLAVNAPTFVAVIEAARAQIDAETAALAQLSATKGGQ